MSDVRVRSATPADDDAIAAVAAATGQDDEWGGSNPAYLRHLAACGRVVVAELAGGVAGFGAVQQVGSGASAVTMLCDLFVLPAAHGSGCGRAMLTELWATATRRMTFSSLHANALPLYTSFGVDAWWPLLYLSGDTARLPPADKWMLRPATAREAGQLERGWTGVDRSADYEAWAGRAEAQTIVVSRAAEVTGAGTILRSGPERGVVHLATASGAADDTAAALVVQTLRQLGGAKGDPGHVCLPGPHPAVRALLGAGWRVTEFDLFMASEPGLLDARRAVPSPAQA